MSKRKSITMRIRPTPTIVERNISEVLDALQSSTSSSRRGNSSLDRSGTRRSDTETGSPAYQQFQSALPTERSGGPTHSSPRRPFDTMNSVTIKRRRRSSSEESTPPLLTSTTPSASATSSKSVRISNGVDFLKELECSNCSKIVGTPLHMCLSGHLSCNNCFGDLIVCGQSGCRKAFVQGEECTRTLQNLLNLVETTCSNNGCNVLLKMENLSSHLDVCVLRPVPCFQQHSTVCSGRRIPLQEYENHILIKHRGEHCTGNPFPITLHLESSTSPKIFTFSGRVFIVNIDRDDQNSIRIWVSTLSPETVARNYIANFKIQKPGNNDRKLYLEWSASVHNVRMSSNSILRAGDCGLFHGAALKPYSVVRVGSAGRLIEDEITVTVHISETEEGQDTE